MIAQEFKFRRLRISYYREWNESSNSCLERFMFHHLNWNYFWHWRFDYTVDVRASSHVTFGAGLPLNEHSNLSSFSATPNTFALPSASCGATNFGASERQYKVGLQVIGFARVDLHLTLTSIESVASGISTPL